MDFGSPIVHSLASAHQQPAHTGEKASASGRNARIFGSVLQRPTDSFDASRQCDQEIHLYIAFERAADDSARSSPCQSSLQKREMQSPVSRRVRCGLRLETFVLPPCPARNLPRRAYCCGFLCSAGFAQDLYSQSCCRHTLQSNAL